MTSSSDKFGLVALEIKLNIEIPSAVRQLVGILLPLVKAESLNVNLNLAYSAYFFVIHCDSALFVPFFVCNHNA